MDFYNGGEIKTPWVIGKPGDKTVRYGPDRRKFVKNPYFAEGSEIKLFYGMNQSGERTVILSFTAASDEDMVHHYEISVKDGRGTEIIFKRHLSDFYRHPDPSQMEKTVSIDICDIIPGDYTVGIKAVNSWDKKSAVLKAKISLEGLGGLNDRK